MAKNMLNQFMLDTDTASFIIKNRTSRILDRLMTLEMKQIHLSMISYGELLFGVAKSSSKKINKGVIDAFACNLTVMPWDEFAADQYGQVRAHLENIGKPIGSLDTLIASHALSLGMVLVTNNTKHVKNVPKLKLENWV